MTIHTKLGAAVKHIERAEQSMIDGLAQPNEATVHETQERIDLYKTHPRLEQAGFKSINTMGD